MITTATARRAAGDWAGACTAARVDVDLDLRAAVRRHGAGIARLIRADLHHLVPDLLRWHLPRVAPDGLLRPGLTLTLARHEHVHLVARTAPAWADAGQRISLALWSPGDDGRHPDRRFRLDLHRCLWDARHSATLAARFRDEPPADQWAREARILRSADGLADEPVIVRTGARRLWSLTADGAPPRRWDPRTRRPDHPVLPDASTRILPDLVLLREGAITPAELHPLVAAALGFTGSPPPPPEPPGDRLVECGGARHRIRLVDGVLTPVDHSAAELRREEMLVTLGGPPLPCLRAIDAAIRRPESLDDIRARLDHGDLGGALDAVDALLGPDAVLRDGALRDELESAAERQATFALYRAGLTGHAPPKTLPDRRTRPGRGFERRTAARRTANLS